MNEKGVTLLEVILSLVIVSIILLSFFQLYIQSNKTAVSQNEHLVLYNLANAELERFKISPIEFTEATNTLAIQTQPDRVRALDSESTNEWHFTSDFHSSTGATYKVLIKRTPNTTEENRLSILDLSITVTSSQSNAKGVVEGYVPFIKK